MWLSTFMRFNRIYQLAGLLILCVGLNSCQDNSWESLFNGIDLEGWTVKCIPADQGKTYWSVEDGSIICNSMGDAEHNYVWLCTDREFGDFRLKLRFQVFRESPGNSGVQFRSNYDDSPEANYGGWLNGPQADIHGPLPYRTGLIYDETEGIRRWIHPSLPDWRISPEQAPESALKTILFYYEDDPVKWNDLEITCSSMSIQTRVNGNLVSDFEATGILDDEIHHSEGSGEIGCIAFQLHMDDELLIKFKDIYIQELGR